MGKKEALLVLLIMAVLGKAIGFKEEEEWWREREEVLGKEERFLMKDSKQVIETEAGEMRVMRSSPSRFILDRPMHIGFITMEPKSLFVPQYLDSDLIIFVRRGEVKLGMIYKDELAERRMKGGDVYRIPAGSVFYMVNVAEGQRLQIICSIDKSESMGYGSFQSFFIAGGTYPASVLAGFDQDTLATAFNVSSTELKRILSRQRQGPIVYVSESESPRVWSKFLQVKHGDRLSKIADITEDSEEAEKNKPLSWRKLMGSIFGKENRDKTKKRTGKSPDSYNLYDKTPDFRNAYGWSVALDEGEYSPLGHSGTGVYLVNLTAGSMMAPHVNPTATEYGVVLKGTGTIQIVYPNGTSAMNVEVSEGDVFWVPRYFPFCQIASRTGPFEFFGFTTSSRKNRPQFLAGASSILHTLRSPEMATAFDMSDDELGQLLDAQYEAIILPSAEIAPPHKEDEKRRRKEEERRERETERKEGETIWSFWSTVMGF